MAVIPASLPPFLDDSPPFTDDDLDALIAWADDKFQSIEDEHPAQKADRWSVTDTASAEWAMRRYAALDAQVAARQAEADAWIAQVRDWLDRTTKPLVRRRQFFEGHLTDYALRLRYEDPTFKTLKLPSGDVPTRLVPARPEVQDSARFVEWAKKMLPRAVRTKEEPVMGGIL